MRYRALLILVLLSVIIAPHLCQAFWETNSNADLGFDSFYVKTNHLGWIIAGVFAIGAAAFIFFTGGTGSPVVVGIGTWIGNAAGLSGIAATNFGLALLGGGSIAAGGFGIAGGTALLTAAVSFTTDIVVNYSTNNLIEHFDTQRFHEQTKGLPMLPLPRNESGPRSYEDAMKIVHQRYHWDRAQADEENQEVLRDVLTSVSGGLASDAGSVADRQRLGTLQALALLQLGRNDEARAATENVIRSFVVNERAENPEAQGRFAGSDYIGIALDPDFRAVSRTKLTLPLAIWGASALASEAVDIHRAVQAACAAIGLEPDSALVPLVVGSELGFLSARQDRLDAWHFAMLRYTVEEHVKDGKLRVPSLQLILIRGMIMLKTQQDFVGNVVRLPVEQLARFRAVTQVTNALHKYDRYLAEARSSLNDIRSDHAAMSDGNIREEIEKCAVSLDKYASDRARLESMATRFRWRAYTAKPMWMVELAVAVFLVLVVVWFRKTHVAPQH